MNFNELAQRLANLEAFVDSLKSDPKRRGPRYAHDDKLAQNLVELKRLAADAEAAIANGEEPPPSENGQ